MKKKSIFFTLVALLFCVVFTSCSSDEEITQESPSEEYVDKAKNILTNEIVLSTKAWMGTVDKTHLESGCPTKFNFNWNDDGTMTLTLNDFHVGAMPFNITFKCKNKFMKLNTWEKDEYKGDGWVKFKGTDGVVSTTSTDEDYKGGSGATVNGYLNVNTLQIQFIVDYNMMGVTSQCPLQVIDKNRINTFDAEFDQYEKDLAQWKKENGEG